MGNNRRNRRSRSAPPGHQTVSVCPSKHGWLHDRVAALNRLTGWRLRVANIATAILIPALLLLALEGLLAVCRVGYPTNFCLKDPAGPAYIENAKFLWQFYSRKTNLRPTPFTASLEKPSNTVRILVLGESAAAGTPDPAYNFARILERMLQAQYPQSKIELINAAMRGVNSHILLPAARDACAKLHPDLVLVYMGNNETVGLHAPGPRSGRLTGHLGLLRAIQWVRTTHLGQLLDPVLMKLNQEGAAAEAQDEAFFQARRVAADDPRRAAVYANFRQNLEGICAAADRAHAALLLSTVAVNLKDCPPVGSLHRSDLNEADLRRWKDSFDAGVSAQAFGRFDVAASNFLASAALDDHFAELHFRLGQCLLSSGNPAEARQQFTRACDWDALQFRADARLNEITRQIAGTRKHARLRLVDAEQLLADADPDGLGIPGERLFQDHVHPTFDGDYLLAKSMLPVVLELLGAGLGAPASAPSLTRNECARRLAFTRVTEGQLFSQIVQQTSLPPFTSQFDHAVRQKRAEQRLAQEFGKLGPTDLQAAIRVFQAAVAQTPGDWLLRFNFARLQMVARDFQAAAVEFEAAGRLMPHYSSIQVGLSAALRGLGKRQEALDLLLRELQSDPDSQDLKNGIETLRGELDKPRGG